MTEKHTFKAIIEIPTDLAQAFGHDPQASTFFDGLAFSHRREYVNWINEAKQETTRQTRIAKTIELLKQGKKAR